jgi:hypothetical protein
MNKKEIKKFIKENESWHHTFHSIFKWYDDAISLNIYPDNLDQNLVNQLEIDREKHDFTNDHVQTAKDIIDINAELNRSDHRDFLPNILPYEVTQHYPVVRIVREVKQYSDEWDESSDNRNCARALKMCKTITNIYAQVEGDSAVQHFSYHAKTGYTQLSYSSQVDNVSIDYKNVTGEEIQLPHDEVISMERNTNLQDTTIMWKHHDFVSIANLFISVLDDLNHINIEASITDRQNIAKVSETYKALNSMYGESESVKKYKVTPEIVKLETA